MGFPSRNTEIVLFLRKNDKIVHLNSFGCSDSFLFYVIKPMQPNILSAFFVLSSKDYPSQRAVSKSSVDHFVFERCPGLEQKRRVGWRTLPGGHTSNSPNELKDQRFMKCSGVYFLDLAR